MGLNRREGAAGVTDAVKPAIGNVEGDENAAGAEDAESFTEHLILELWGFEMV